MKYLSFYLMLHVTLYTKLIFINLDDNNIKLKIYELYLSFFISIEEGFLPRKKGEYKKTGQDVL